MSTIRLAMIVTLLLLTCALVQWLRAGDTFPLAQVFPFLGGYEPGLYDLAGLAMLLIAIHGIRGLSRTDDE